jgi:hypothetical protein
LNLGDFDVFGDDVVEERWEGIPGIGRSVGGIGGRSGLDDVDLPGPESEQEAEPGEKKDAAVLVDWIEDRDRAGFFVDGVDGGRLPQGRYVKSHGCWL